MKNFHLNLVSINLLHTNYLTMRRSSIPLHSKRHAALIDHLDPAENRVDPHKGIVTHLLIGIGMRNDTVGHTHEDWFTYKEGELFIQIPSDEKCRKQANEGNDSCGECDNGRYNPKTPAGAGRQILVPNTYYNFHTDAEEYHGLRDRVESYFGLSAPGAPDHAQYGFSMIQADGRDGASVHTGGDWVRDVCATSEINPSRRAKTLRQHLEPKDATAREKIKDYGTDSDGNGIPDVFPHDLRASFCTQLCRTKNEAKNPDLMYIKNKTGHKNTETLEGYVEFGNDEINVEKEKNLH